MICQAVPPDPGPVWINGEWYVPECLRSAEAEPSDAEANETTKARSWDSETP